MQYGTCFGASDPVMKMVRTFLFLAVAAAACGQGRLPMQDDLWREFDIYRGRLLDLARAIPEDRYGWRPAKDVRSVQEVILHVALNNYMLLDMMERPVPKDLYPDLPKTEPERQRQIARRNLDLEKQLAGKQNMIAIAERAFAAAAEPLRNTSGAGLNQPAMFGDRKTTIGGLQLRTVAHLHEHLGQLIAYARSAGVVPPWSQ
jgi:uncharacterized damage-inducible protein DinB